MVATRTSKRADEVGDDGGLEVRVAEAHRGLIDDDEDRSVASHRGHVVGEVVQGIGRDPDAAQPDRPPGRGTRAAVEARTQPVEVGRIGHAGPGGHDTAPGALDAAASNVGSTTSNSARYRA